MRRPCRWPSRSRWNSAKARETRKPSCRCFRRCFRRRCWLHLGCSCLLPRQRFRPRHPWLNLRFWNHLRRLRHQRSRPSCWRRRSRSHRLHLPRRWPSHLSRSRHRWQSHLSRSSHRWQSRPLHSRRRWRAARYTRAAAGRATCRAGAATGRTACRARPAAGRGAGRAGPAPPVPPCVAPPVEGVLLAPTVPLPPLPPVAGWVAPPDGLASRGVWLLLVELQPRPSPAPQNRTRAAVTLNRNCDLLNPSGLHCIHPSRKSGLAIADAACPAVTGICRGRHRAVLVKKQGCSLAQSPRQATRSRPRSRRSTACGYRGTSVRFFR